MSAFVDTQNALAHVFAVTELLDDIVDYFLTDGLALRTLSLVCKLWSLSTARHLFRRVKVYRWDIHTGRNDTFLPRLRALVASPRTAHNIWRLDLSYLPVSVKDDSLSVRILQLVLAGLPQLRVLSVHNPSILPAQTAIEDAPSRPLALPDPQLFSHTLACFELELTSSSRAARLAFSLERVLSLFTRLDKLSYWNRCNDPEDASQGPTLDDNWTGGVEVSQLDLRWDARSRDVWKICRTIDGSKVRALTLTLTALDGNVAASVNTVLARHTPHVDRISIEVLYVHSQWTKLAATAHDRVRRSFTFAFASIPLRTLQLRLSLFNDPAFFTHQNTLLWEPLLASALAPSASPLPLLAHLDIVLDLQPHDIYRDLRPAVSAVAALNWTLLEHSPKGLAVSVLVDSLALRLKSPDVLVDAIKAAVPARIAKLMRFAV